MAALGEAGAPVVVLRSLQDCPIAHVTVYRNQAEIYRVIALPSDEVEAGHHDIVVKGLAKEVDSNTLRVKGLGAFEILEVTMETSYPEPEEEEKTRENELKKEIKEVRAQLAAAEQSSSTLKGAKAHAEQYMENFVASVAVDPARNHTASNMEPEAVSVEAMLRVMDFYRSQHERLDEQFFKGIENVEQLKKRLNRLQQELSQVSRPGGAAGVQVRNDATISINVTQPNTYIELTLSYILPNASWTPSYDMRLSSGDQTMTLTYYGQVKQQTGEAWNGCTMSLSTAEPAIQGFPPTLGSKTVTTAVASSWSGRSTHMLAMSPSMPMASMPPPPPAAGPPMERQALRDAPVVSTSVAKQDAVGASLFEIPRKVFIDSDGKSHKVTIANLQMQAQLTHFASPAVSSHAYIQAKAANPSDYSLLKSPNMSVYLDGSFITKTELPDNVSPGESFTTFVGVDPTVKLEYRPVKTRERTSGWMTKTVTMSYEYATIVRNTKASDINIFVTDSVPRCEAERVTVELTAPAATELTPLTAALATEEVPSLTDKQLIQQLIERGATNITVQNTATNNLIWARSVPAGGVITLPMHYNISRPTDVQIDIETRN